MIRKQFFIDEEQARRLKALAARLGVAEAELVREGIGNVLESKEAEDDWKAAFRQSAGIWADRDDLDELSTDFRSRWNRRLLPGQDPVEDVE